MMNDWRELAVRDALYKKMVDANGVKGRLVELCEELAELDEKRRYKLDDLLERYNKGEFKGENNAI
jgi:hypothetical protein